MSIANIDKLVGWAIVLLFILAIFSFSYSLHHSLTEWMKERVELEERVTHTRGWHGHRLTEEAKAANREYIKEIRRVVDK